MTSISVGGIVQQQFKHDSTGRQIWSRDYNRLTVEDPIVVDTAKVFDSLGRTVEEALTIGGGDAEYVTTAFTGQRRSAMVYPNGRGRQMPTDLANYVEDTIRAAEKPSINRITKIPIQARRGLPTRQIPTDLASDVEDAMRVAESLR